MQLGHTLQWALPHFQAYTVLLVRIAGEGCTLERLGIAPATGA